MCNMLVVLIYLYTILFLVVFSLKTMGFISFHINTYPIMFLLLGFAIVFFLHVSRNIVLLSLNIVFLSFISIFSLVNF